MAIPGSGKAKIFQKLSVTKQKAADNDVYGTDRICEVVENDPA